MTSVLRTRTVSEPRGFMKMLVAQDSDQILGITVFGFETSEPMAVIQTAMFARLPYTKLRKMVLTHRTMAEEIGRPPRSSQRLTHTHYFHVQF